MIPYHEVLFFFFFILGNEVYSFSLFTGRDLHKLVPMSHVYRQAFANQVGPIAKVKTEDGFYYCQGHYVSPTGADCNELLNVPPLESPLAMYPWPYQQLYLLKSIGATMGYKLIVDFFFFLFFSNTDGTWIVRNDTSDWMDVVPKRLAFSLNVLNTLSNSIESPPLNVSTPQLYFYPLSRVVNKNFEVITSEKVTPNGTEPKCDPQLFKRAAREISNIIGNLTKSAFTYTDTDIITLQYKVSFYFCCKCK